MGGYATLPNVSGARPLEGDEVGRLWRQFRATEVVPCPSDAAPMALAVDAANGIYKLVCTRCGGASPWFMSSADGEVRIVTGGVQGRAGSIDV